VHLREDMESSNWGVEAKAENIVSLYHGVLRNMSSDIKSGRLGRLQLEFKGQIFADLVNFAKDAIDQNTKDVAAVLAASALEDALKRFALTEGIDVEDKDLSTVINALKSAGLLSATHSSLLKGMVPFRNKALHAEWSKIDFAEVHVVIAFLEEFLAKRFI